MGNCCLIPTKSVHTGEKPVKNCSPGDGGVGDGQVEPPGDGGSTATSAKLKVFSLAELKSATGNFRADSVVGEGGFGRVFKGYIDEKTWSPTKYGHGMPVAIKKSNPDSEQGHKEWQAEVELLGKFRHPNLVKLLGYCWEENQFLLVYEYMQGGSLEAHLFSEIEAKAIPWETRIKIAMGAARGLAFLHSTGDKNVIFRDFKASNILLDREFNAKISDFGLAKLGPEIGNSHVTTQIVGTYGYAAPEYIATGHLYVLSDVYGFGVVLLELLTGLRVHDPSRPNGQRDLVEWAKPLLPHKRKLRNLIDARLEGQYPSTGAYRMAVLILSCVETNPRCRPNMKEVLKTLEEIGSIKMKPKLLGAKLNRDHDRRRGSGGARKFKDGH